MKPRLKNHELRLPLGHEFGAGRATAKHADRRHKRQRTRAARKAQAAREESA